MNTCNHRIYYSSSEKMSEVPARSVHCIVTSPPYPMIEMWDNIFGRWDPKIKNALNQEKANLAYESMHNKLKLVWKECYRVLVDGGFICINIGDATRKVGDSFCLYPNHARIIEQCRALGFQSLPVVLWRKQTNAPNKFMGSGMYPTGAYVTLEHEYILIFRKGNKRPYRSEKEKTRRRESAFFWEERNTWFSDIWDFKGIRQKLNPDNARKRSGAYPFELPFRIINMYSNLHNTILDPFLGTGTSTVAAMIAGRNSIGFETDTTLSTEITSQFENLRETAEIRLTERLYKHKACVQDYIHRGKSMKHTSSYYDFPVMTAWEKNIYLPYLQRINIEDSSNMISYYKNSEEFIKNTYSTIDIQENLKGTEKSESNEPQDPDQSMKGEEKETDLEGQMLLDLSFE